MDDSRAAFQNIVYQEISEWFDDSEIEPVEGVYDDYLRESLDRKAGIDFWLIHEGMETIASRVQGYRPGISAGLDISTFSVRYSRDGSENTELQKRVKAMEEGWQYPDYTVQAYVAEDVVRDDKGNIIDGELLNAACADTDDLIPYTDAGDVETHIGERGSDETEKFYYVHWLDYRLFYDLKCYREPTVQGFAPPLKPTFNPVRGESSQNQSSLVEYFDD